MELVTSELHASLIIPTTFLKVKTKKNAFKAIWFNNRVFYFDS